jgi:hypothetical protein
MVKLAATTRRALDGMGFAPNPTAVGSGAGSFAGT